MRIYQRQRDRRQTSAQWASENPVLLEGEHAYDTTMDNYKVGDGVTPWLSLRWALPIVSTSTPAIAPAGSVWLKPLP